MRSAPLFTRHSPRRSLLACALLAVAFALSSPAAEVIDSQTFPIQPGWNAIYLEVSPDSSQPAAVFASLAGVQQVWSFLTPRSSVQYINDPANGLWNVPGWKVWLPADSQHPENASLTNLQAIIGHQAYLIKYGGTTATTLTISGQAGYRAVTWNPDSFTLAGLPVNPASAVLAGDYFANDVSHKSQARYYLTPTGTWLPLPDTGSLKRGQAYWLYTKGGSTYQAAADFNFGGGHSLDYGSTATERVLSFTNRTAAAVEVTLTAPSGVPLSYQTTDSTTHLPVWNPLTSYVVTVAVNATTNLSVGVLRSQLAANSDLGALCTVAVRGVAVNGVTPPKLDSLFKVPVTVQSLGSAAAVSSNARGRSNQAATSTNPDAGLWVGSINVNQIDEVNTTVGSVTNGVATITTPPARTGTPSPFTMRLLLHVDDGGTVQLLKQVIVMQKSATSPTNPGAPVLVTDQSLISSFDAASQRDGAPFSPRISSIGYDFASNNLTLSGAFGSTLTGTVAIPRNLPTNPFLHRYNPDHDDVPAEAGEVWDVSRALTLTFGSGNSTSNEPGADGSSQRAGTYVESITGLHRFPISVAGTFTLRHINTIGALDPAP